MHKTKQKKEEKETNRRLICQIDENGSALFYMCMEWHLENPN